MDGGEIGDNNTITPKRFSGVLLMVVVVVVVVGKEGRGPGVLSVRLAD